MRAKLEGAPLNDQQKAQAGVVILGECTGEPHFFHAECIEGHYNSMKGNTGAGASHYKCMICQKSYGVRTGDMPRGTMRWY